MEAAIEAGADDVRSTDQYHEVVTEPEAFLTVKAQLEAEEAADRRRGESR